MSTPSVFWHNENRVSTFVPGQDIPREFYAKYASAPMDIPNRHSKEGFRAAGTITFFGNRVMCIKPTNGFGDYELTFPKGRCDPEDACLQHTAIRETLEETGILTQLTGKYIDARKSKGMVRYYYAVPYAGCFSDMCWETQAVSLVPINMIGDLITAFTDRPIVERILNG